MPAEPTTLAIDIGASRTRLSLVRDGQRLGDRVERETRTFVAAEERGIVDRLAASAAKLAGASEPGPAAVGISVAAAVSRDGSILQRRDFGIPSGPLLRDRIAAELRVPVTVENDANCAAVAERALGAARGCDWAAVLTLGTNIGLGLIVDGRLVRGARGAAGEVGLLLVPANEGDAGTLGRGTSRGPAGYAWIEELVGGGALAGGQQRHVLTGQAQADPALRPLATRAVEGWAVIIADLMVLLDLEVVVLTGGVAVDAAHLLPALRRRVAELVAHAPEIRLGSLGPDAELLGADLVARAALRRDDPRAAAATDARAGLSAQSTGGWE